MAVGDAHRECGDTPAAIDAYRHVLEIDPAHARARTAIVDALRATGNAEEAERYRMVGTGR